jgi:hypothetical protein
VRSPISISQVGYYWIIPKPWLKTIDKSVPAMPIWLVVSTPLKNSQLGLSFPIYGKKHPNHKPAILYIF